MFPVWTFPMNGSWQGDSWKFEQGYRKMSWNEWCRPADLNCGRTDYDGEGQHSVAAKPRHKAPRGDLPLFGEATE